MSGYSVSPQALDDLFEIWQYIAQDSEEAADRVQREFYETFSSLAQTPGQGHSRKDLTQRHVLFFPLYSYLIVYRPDVEEIRILTVVHGRRNVKRILKQRNL